MSSKIVFVLLVASLVALSQKHCAEGARCTVSGLEVLLTECKLSCGDDYANSPIGTCDGLYQCCMPNPMKFIPQRMNIKTD
ncbi:hypothetical protein HA402_015179 [Bradysia odoriphaga]|nr:hypothetical protein HA402_015179 [Bradysia odoriphaga]